MQRVSIQWTTTAKEELRTLPPKVRRGLLDKANELLQTDDPSSVHKPLTGPLQGYYRICYSRYRAIYSVEKQTLPDGDIRVHVIINFVAVGTRKEGDKSDLYRIATKLLSFLDDPATADAPSPKRKPKHK